MNITISKRVAIEFQKYIKIAIFESNLEEECLRESLKLFGLDSDDWQPNKLILIELDSCITCFSHILNGDILQLRIKQNKTSLDIDSSQSNEIAEAKSLRSIFDDSNEDFYNDNVQIEDLLDGDVSYEDSEAEELNDVLQSFSYPENER